MSPSTRRRVAAILLVLVIILVLLLLLRCPGKRQAPTATIPSAQPATAPATTPAAAPATTPAPPAEPEERLTPAAITAPERITAGSPIAVTWTGPDNKGDYITIVQADAANEALGHYQETRLGASLTITAPIEPGPHELRYVTARSRAILGRAKIEVVAAGATISAPDEVILGSKFAVTWTGPNNKGDYVTIVKKGAPDAQYGSYADADRPQPGSLTAPTDTGEAELRYVTGQGKKVLARRPIRITRPEVSLTAPDRAIAGTTIDVTWTGPNNSGDYVTIVTASTPDGQYGNYTNTSSGNPLRLLIPIMTGQAELRYMTGADNKVLARRAIAIDAAQVTLTAPPEAKAESEVSITWTGPNNPGDYITIVPAATPDGQYRAYTQTTAGSPLNVTSPKNAGEAEVRYMTGQGNKVLARVKIKITS